MMSREHREPLVAELAEARTDLVDQDDLPTTTPANVIVPPSSSPCSSLKRARMRSNQRSRRHAVGAVRAGTHAERHHLGPRWAAGAGPAARDPGSGGAEAGGGAGPPRRRRSTAGPAEADVGHASRRRARFHRPGFRGSGRGTMSERLRALAGRARRPPPFHRSAPRQPVLRRRRSVRRDRDPIPVGVVLPGGGRGDVEALSAAVERMLDSPELGSGRGEAAQLTLTSATCVGSPRATWMRSVFSSPGPGSGAAPAR
jgi:hypothetical protein